MNGVDDALTCKFIRYSQLDELQDGRGVDLGIWGGGWMHVPVGEERETCEEEIEGIVEDI